MVEVPTREPTFMDVWEWYQLKKQLASLQEQEKLLRRFISKGFFPKLREGTESMPLPDGWALRCAAKINRTLDRAVLEAKTAAWHDEGIPLAKLIENKPSLVLKEYRKLGDNLKTVFDDCVTEKSGLPTLDLIEPKKDED